MRVFQHIEISLTQQCMFFVCSILMGAVIGAIYDFFRILRLAVKHSAPAVFIEDMLFCAVSCCIMILTVFCANYGRVRWFGAAGSLGGFVLYRQTIGRMVVGAANLIIGFVKKYIIGPVRFAFCFALGLVRKIAAGFATAVGRLRCHAYRGRILKMAKKGFGL